MVRKVMTDSDLVVACKNIGFDLTCGACAALFYTGVPIEKNSGVCFNEHDHTCQTGGRTETARADGAEAALAIQTERTIRAETQCKQLLAAIQTATVGDLTDSDRVSKYRACLLCRRDLNVCERDYRVCLETNALDRACKGAKVRALIPLDVSLLPIAQARLDEGLASARRGEISPWKRSDLKLPPGACHDCGGEGQVVQHHGSDDNYDGANCSTCDGSGLAPSPIRDMVLEFHATFLPEQTRPTVGVPNDDLVRLRVKLPFEEAFELLDASFKFDEAERINYEVAKQNVMQIIERADIEVDLVEVADAFADLAYVVEGGNLAYGIDSRPVLIEVQRSNMSKVGGHRSESGKWIKPSTYSPPDIASVLKKQGWQP